MSSLLSHALDAIQAKTRERMAGLAVAGLALLVGLARFLKNTTPLSTSSG